MSTPDLNAEFALAMSDLEDVLEQLEQHGPSYLHRLMHHDGPLRPTRPRTLTPTVAKIVREIADDALVRAAARRPLAPSQTFEEVR